MLKEIDKTDVISLMGSLVLTLLFENENISLERRKKVDRKECFCVF